MGEVEIQSPEFFRGKLTETLPEEGGGNLINK